MAKRPFRVVKAHLFAAVSALLVLAGSARSEPPAPPVKPPGPVLRAYDVQYKGPGRERMIAILKAQIGKPMTDNVMEAVVRELSQRDVVIPSFRIFGEPVEGGVKVIIPELVITEKPTGPHRVK